MTERRTWPVVLAGLRLIRVENCILGAATTVIGYASAQRIGATGRIKLMVLLIVGLVVAFGNVLNDLVDEEGDRIAKPERPLVSGLVSRRQASIVAAVLPTSALIAGFMSARRLLPFIGGVILLSIAYSLRLKGVPFVGNVVVAVLAGSTLLFGALAGGTPTRATAVGCALITLAFFCFELAKTIEDADADAAVGLTTAAHVLSRSGQIWAILTASVVYSVAVSVVGVALEPDDGFWLVYVPVLPFLVYSAGAVRRRRGAQLPMQPFIRAGKALWFVGLLGLLGASGHARHAQGATVRFAGPPVVVFLQVPRMRPPLS